MKITIDEIQKQNDAIIDKLCKERGDIFKPFKLMQFRLSKELTVECYNCTEIIPNGPYFQYDDTCYTYFNRARYNNRVIRLNDRSFAMMNMGMDSKTPFQLFEVLGKAGTINLSYGELDRLKELRPDSFAGLPDRFVGMPIDEMQKANDSCHYQIRQKLPNKLFETWFKDCHNEAQKDRLSIYETMIEDDVILTYDGLYVCSKS